jgi:predicted ATPase
MKLGRLHIRSRFKNLADFQIDFGQDSEMTVLVGRNGTGKSNLLEALTIIFRDLDLGLRPAFSYELCYFCHEHAITVDANPDRRGQLGYELTANGQHLTWRAFHDNPTREYLPSFVFGYYSGPGNRMERHFERHQEVFYRQLLNNNEQPLRRLFFARPVHSQFVLLAFFLDRDPAVATFLREHLWIEHFDYALFIMREPPWPWKNRQGDPRFWNARGVVSHFLARLYALALAPCRLKLRVPTGFKTQQSLEHLYLFLPDLEHVRRLAGHYDTQQDFFKALESTYISKLISGVRISIRARKVDGSLTFRELSEGEQQLLMVLGLLRFTREDESLFLLDEPDTHLNPAWSVQYLKFLREIGGAHENSHVIMATHDPLVISGLDRSQVQVLQRDDATGRIEAQQPESDPKYMGVPALLLSEVYGLRSILPPATMALLDEKRQLAAKPELTDEDRQTLQRLDEKLEEADLLAENRDPMYRDFVLAYARLQHEHGLDKPVLSPEEREELHELALSILREQLPEGDAK